jgi:hypothetical protein
MQFAWSGWGKLRETSVKIIHVTAEIGTELLRTTSQKHYRVRQFNEWTMTCFGCAVNSNNFLFPYSPFHNTTCFGLYRPSSGEIVAIVEQVIVTDATGYPPPKKIKIINGRWTKFTNPVILSVTGHRQNHLESIYKFHASNRSGRVREFRPSPSQ